MCLRGGNGFCNGNESQQTNGLRVSAHSIHLQWTEELFFWNTAKGDICTNCIKNKDESELLHCSILQPFCFIWLHCESFHWQASWFQEGQTLPIWLVSPCNPFFGVCICQRYTQLGTVQMATDLLPSCLAFCSLDILWLSQCWAWYRAPKSCSGKRPVSFCHVLWCVPSYTLPYYFTKNKVLTPYRLVTIAALPEPVLPTKFFIRIFIYVTVTHTKSHLCGWNCFHLMVFHLDIIKSTKASICNGYLGFIAVVSAWVSDCLQLEVNFFPFSDI